jgi:hypothetical protein
MEFTPCGFYNFKDAKGTFSPYFAVIRSFSCCQAFCQDGIKKLDIIDECRPFVEFPYQKTPFLGGLIGKIGSEKMPEMIYLHRSFSYI